MKIAVYGTLKVGYGNHALIKNQTKLKNSFVKCYGITGTGFPKGNFKKISDDFILLEVEVYDIENEIRIKQIDQLEGHPNRYKRFIIKDENGDPMWIYNMDNILDIDKTSINYIKDNKYRR